MTTEPDSPEEFANRLKAEVARSVAGNVELAARLNGLVKTATSGATQPVTDSRQLLNRWLDLNLSVFTVLNEHTRGMLNDLITVAERSLGQPVAEDGSNDDTSPREVELRARVGERVSFPFVVDNDYDRAVTAHFESAPNELASDPIPSAAVTFEPPTLTVPGGERAIATAHIDVDDSFGPGRTYATTIRVLGFEGREIAVKLTTLGATETSVEPEPDAAHESGTTAAREQPDKERGAVSGDGES